MRTTIEIPDEQRARLLEIAGRRGEKGFSKLVQEALELYLNDHERRDAVETAQRLQGRLSDEGACVSRFWIDDAAPPRAFGPG